MQEEYRGDELKLVGAQFGVKEGLFVQELRSDVRLGVFAIIFVVFIILMYTDSFFYTFCISATLLLSIGVAFFVYTVILGIKFFPFLNLLAMILVVAVGADDAFLFMYQYRKHKEDASRKWSPALLNCDINNIKEEHSDKEELMEYHRRRVISGLSDALSHAAISMFVTSATTSVAFFANLVSEIIVLRCFGLYAGTLMIINYILVIIILPAAIIVSDAGVKSFNISKFFIWRMKSRITQLWHSVATSFDIVFSRLIPQIVYIIRIPLTLLTLIAFVVSIYAIVKTPGIRLPERNSIQFLRSNHPYEWFDENAATMFDFSIGRRPKMSIISVWGIKPTTSGSSLIPKEKGSLNVDIGFADNLSNNLLEFQISIAQTCQPSNQSKCGAKIMRKSFSGDMLSRCFLQFGHATTLPVFKQWQQENGDGPIFDKSGDFLAYFLLTYSKYNLSTVFKEMKPFFDFMRSVKVEQREIFKFGQPLILTTTHIAKLYDLLERILNGTALSVFISLMVSMTVIVFITFDVTLSLLAIICISTVVTVTIAVVLWAGWTVNVVEATIIVLTIGMSFDYCLHFAIGFRLHKNGDFR
uniref:SSD domain-containing protein n=1 Tax=Elaeophora elaphi TaxID=1147741 RepID=A0A0R3RIZ9_9BILA